MYGQSPNGKRCFLNIDVPFLMSPIGTLPEAGSEYRDRRECERLLL